MMAAQTNFRSSFFDHGMAKQPGCLHFHIDCAQGMENSLFLLDVAKYFDHKGWPSKITNIETAISGHHSNDPEFLADYKVHTPELLTKSNTFSSYLTTVIPEYLLNAEDIDKLCETIKQELKMLLASHNDHRTACEIERVSYYLDGVVVNSANPKQIKLSDNFEKFEVHHFVDLYSDTPIVQAELEPFYKELKIPIGGWFTLYNNGVHSLRSVKFSNNLDIDVVLSEQEVLHNFVKDKYACYQPKITCVIEQILDVWKNEP